MATEIAWGDLRREIDLREVEAALGIEATEVGDEDVASCPLPQHDGMDEHPSFSINNRTYAWNCFACGEGGALFKLVQAMLGLDYDGAIEWLRPYAGDLEVGGTKWWARIDKKLNDPIAPLAHVRVPTLPFFAPGRLAQWREQLHETDYFTSREIGPDTQQAFKVGYDPAYRGHKWTAPAVIIPHFFRGDLVGWQARALTDVKPKYDNSDDFPKKDTLFNWDMATEHPDVPILMVEGAMGVMNLYEMGFLAVSTFGASFSERQIELLSTRTAPIWICGDRDSAGQEATRKAARILSDYVPCDVVPAPEDEKASISDVSKDEVERLIAARKPSFLAFPRL